jgi:uncharacterized membrane protein
MHKTVSAEPSPREIAEKTERAETASAWAVKVPLWFALAALLLGNGFVFVNPPLRAPDEWAHFARAWQISRLRLRPQEQNGILGGYTPIGIETLNKRFEKIAFDGVNFDQIEAARKIPLGESDLKFLAYPSIAEYPSLPFVPQALGVAIARWFVHSSLIVMYFAREANLLAYIAVVVIALVRMPDASCRLTLALVGLVPMALHQAASVSADGLTIALAIFFASTLWRMTHWQRLRGRIDFALLALASVGLTFTKLVYLPLALLVLLVPRHRFASLGRWSCYVGGILLCDCLAISLWMWQFGGVPKLDLNPRVNPQQQKAWIMNHPAAALEVIPATASRFGREIITGVIGTFGWNELMMPALPVAIYFAILAASLIGRRSSIHLMGLGLSLFVAAIELLVMLAGYYIECRPVGEPAIAGFQGRYLVPLLPLLIFWRKDRPAPPGRLGRALLLTAILISAFSIFFLAQELYLHFPGSRVFFRYSD